MFLVNPRGVPCPPYESVYEDREVRCESCGTIIAPAAMLRRTETLLTYGGDDSAATATITRRCPSCRVARVNGSW
jgi:hypothetical protein